MNTLRFEVERIDIASTKSFLDTVAAFERQVPTADLLVFNRLVSSDAGAREIEDAVRAMVGDLEFMIFAKLEQGPLISLLGKPKKMVVYLVGNPVIANRMYEQNPAVGVYAPLRVSIYEDYEGKTHMTYDRPSAVLDQFDDAQIRGIAKVLDEKMTILTENVVR